MAKIIVTHLNPDTDAICAVWLIKRFLPGWKEARVKFVPQGETFRGQPPDSDPEILHVDTGLGKFDHHKDYAKTCSGILVWEYIKKKTGKRDPAIDRLLRVVLDIDRAQDLLWKESTEDRFLFYLSELLGGVIAKKGGEKALGLGMEALDGVYKLMQEKIEAEKILKSAETFRTCWGKGVALETENTSVVYLAERIGYAVVVRRRPVRGHFGIYARPDKGINLTPVYRKIKKLESGASWYLHPSKQLLLCGTFGHPNVVPTRLSLEKIVEILKKA